METGDDTTRRRVLRGGAVALLAGLAGCTNTGSTGTTTAGDTATPADDGSGGSDGSESTADGAEATAGGAGSWRTVELTDVRTEETFTVEQFAGKPVLLEFFAVWCPVCTRQQQHLASTVEDNDDIVAISINTDPNEDAATVRDHLSEYDFDWRYAIAPPAMTRSLIDEFGSVISNPPAAPVVRVCPGGAAGLVSGRGAKSPATLTAAFDEC